jgi:hypothetical protein
MKGGNDGLGTFVTRLSSSPDHAQKFGQYVARLSRLLAIGDDRSCTSKEVTGADKTLDCGGRYL